ncbi:hypothetical protein GCM10007932_47130 [Vibrio penaeicida]|uniref:Uncharacterized protein n=1 Tax=Vibrio penaeicida TaxID=104609 RepID=A0AAV5NXC4_9VIBR|nr:hypothetical protein [Vibrio penaeicida]GLQ75351.1 hypothetical protein GCM10007932_47130 [Vibrio penaeicida]
MYFIVMIESVEVYATYHILNWVINVREYFASVNDDLAIDIFDALIFFDLS